MGISTGQGLRTGCCCCRRDGATARREDGEAYRVVFNITQANPGNGRVSNELAQVARFVNLLALSGLDAQASDIVAVVHGSATPAVVEEKAYRARFGETNPNAALIDELKRNGVDILVCGQALTSAGFPTTVVSPSVDVTLSAMTELADRQLQGYALMP